MSRKPGRRTARVAVLLILGAVFAAACRDGRDAVTGPGSISAAAGGGGKTSSVTVTATDPTFGSQGQVNEAVTITGTGFKQGAKASWQRNGAADPAITVSSTQFVSSTQLIATISIDSAATVTSYDVAVVNTDRTKGIGNLLFNVVKSGAQVTAIIADADATVAPTLQIRSDGLGAYTGSQSLWSEIQGIGDWVLDSYNPPNGTRRAWLEFSQPIAGTGPGGGAPVAVPSGLYLVRFISRCSLQNNSFLTLAPGASMLCPLHVAFDYNGSRYAVQMNPGASSGDPAPETSYATVTCVAPASGPGPCTAWTITPSGAGGRNVARLIKYVSNKRSSSSVSQGDFYFSFSIGVTNP